jgi:hypothetical protein
VVDNGTAPRGPLLAGREPKAGCEQTDPGTGAHWRKRPKGGNTKLAGHIGRAGGAEYPERARQAVQSEVHRGDASEVNRGERRSASCPATPRYGRTVRARQAGKHNLWTLPRGQRFKLSARERTARESRGYATDAAMGARTGGIWATLARGGADDRLAKAKSASAAPTLAITAALIWRTG